MCIDKSYLFIRYTFQVCESILTIYTNMNKSLLTDGKLIKSCFSIEGEINI